MTATRRKSDTTGSGAKVRHTHKPQQSLIVSFAAILSHSIMCRLGSHTRRLVFPCIPFPGRLSHWLQHIRLFSIFRFTEKHRPCWIIRSFNQYEPASTPSASIAGFLDTQVTVRSQSLFSNALLAKSNHTAAGTTCMSMYMARHCARK